MVMTRIVAVLLAAITALWIVPSIGPMVIPARWYLEVDRVLVANSEAGVPPAITSFRTIHRDFTGDFTVYVRRFRDDAATSVPYCTASAQRPFTYFADDGPITDRDMDWWMAIPPNPRCPWGPGRYIATTEWRILLPFDIVLTTTATSNPFVIAE